jgi:DNA-binding NarL/FixJ family response regulator
MPLPSRPLTVVVCESDPIVRTALCGAAEEAGFEVLDTAENGSLLLHRLSFSHPSLVLLTNELHGMSGLEVVHDLHQLDDHPEAILISSDENVRNEAREYDVIGVPSRGDRDALERVLLDAKHLFETGERRSKTDRRSGEDRRKVQDWTKVTMERRSGEERRKGTRRREDVDDGERREGSPDRRVEQDWHQVTRERRESNDRRDGS